LILRQRAVLSLEKLIFVISLHPSIQILNNSLRNSCFDHLSCVLGWHVDIGTLCPFFIHFLLLLLINFSQRFPVEVFRILYMSLLLLLDMSMSFLDSIGSFFLFFLVSKCFIFENFLFGFFFLITSLNYFFYSKFSFFFSLNQVFLNFVHPEKLFLFFDRRVHICTSPHWLSLSCVISPSLHVISWRTGCQIICSLFQVLWQTTSSKRIMNFSQLFCARVNVFPRSRLSQTLLIISHIFC